jgi:hypothetical protein
MHIDHASCNRHARQEAGGNGMATGASAVAALFQLAPSGGTAATCMVRFSMFEPVSTHCTCTPSRTPRTIRIWFLRILAHSHPLRHLLKPISTTLATCGLHHSSLFQICAMVTCGHAPHGFVPCRSSAHRTPHDPPPFTPTAAAHP